MGLKPQFSNSNNWNLIANGSEVAVILSTPTEAYNPIPPIDLATLIDLPTIAVYTYTSNAPSSWRCGGWVSGNIITGLTVGGNSDAEIGRFTLQLNRINIIRFPQVSTTYSIRIYVPKWFRDISYTVWEYTGGGIPDLEGKIDYLETLINTP